MQLYFQSVLTCSRFCTHMVASILLGCSRVAWMVGFVLLMPYQENRLDAFEESMKAFTRGLDSTLLPPPKLLQVGGCVDRR